MSARVWVGVVTSVPAEMASDTMKALLTTAQANGKDVLLVVSCEQPITLQVGNEPKS